MVEKTIEVTTVTAEVNGQVRTIDLVKQRRFRRTGTARPITSMIAKALPVMVELSHLHRMIGASLMHPVATAYALHRTRKGEDKEAAAVLGSHVLIQTAGPSGVGSAFCLVPIGVLSPVGDNGEGAPLVAVMPTLGHDGKLFIRWFPRADYSMVDRHFKD